MGKGENGISPDQKPQRGPATSRGEDGEKASCPGSRCPLLAAAMATFSLPILAAGSLSCGPWPESPAARQVRIVAPLRGNIVQLGDTGNP